MELVDLLYWKPRPTQGSRGAELVQTVQAARRNAARRSQPKTGSTKESGEDEPEPAAAAPSLVRKKRNLSYPADADLETRMAYGRALMCGHDRDYPPELFEDAIPLPDVAPLYSSEADLQNWRNRVYGAADVQTDGNDVPSS
ncbi:hypothetical protein BD410DRAFT_554961 [Rickenella mellea]|uniref:Uncharacterized protein n=1 Tax=Rickenella mellea TaxID=50990 RepID=A0A4Y7PD75_9AGAM|nr:hypothetical protein BD410DRAFT_554961 [Rickenella mellea]